MTCNLPCGGAIQFVLSYWVIEMTTKILRTTLMFAALTTLLPRSSEAVILIEISEGPSADTVLWTFSGESVATGFGFFSDSGIILEAEPVGIFGGFDNFTDVAAPAVSSPGLLSIQSGSAILTFTDIEGGVAAAPPVTANITQGFFDDGDTGADSLERLGFGIDASIEFLEDDLVSVSGAIVFQGASIADFSAGGLPFLSSSTAFGLEENNLPVNLAIVAAVPEPSGIVLACLVGCIAASRRRRAARV